MNFLQSLQNINRKITTICAYVDMTSQCVQTNSIYNNITNVKGQSTKLCGSPGDPGNVWENVEKLCKEIKHIEQNSILLGFDDYEWITDYIKRHYGLLSSRRTEYMKIANIFKTTIDTLFSSDCEIKDLNGNGEKGLFEFNFSIPTKFLSLWIESHYEDESGNIYVYFHVESSKKKDHAKDW